MAVGDARMPAPRRPGPLGVLRDVLRHGGPGYLQFAITNLCNANCDFCGFAVDRFDRSRQRQVTLAEARRVVDVCVRHHIGYLLFVGGEPLVHPALVDMVACASSQGVHPMICTNGSLWTEENMRKLVDAGLGRVIMSIDADDVQRHETHRRLPDVCRKIEAANAFFQANRVPTTASVTASRLIRDYAALPDLLLRLGFTHCTFSYPLTTLKSSYLGFSDSTLVQYRPEELVEVFEQIKRLKTNGRLHVANPTASLEDMQRHLRGEREHFGCLGGFKYFYVDWNLQLYRCHNWATPMCHIDEFDGSQAVRDGCQQCMIDCYRDPSVMHHVGISVHDAWHELKQGRLAAAGRVLWDRRNWDSLKAAWAEREGFGRSK